MLRLRVFEGSSGRQGIVWPPLFAPLAGALRPQTQPRTPGQIGTKRDGGFELILCAQELLLVRCR